jgi:hypothetical protein
LSDSALSVLRAARSGLGDIRRNPPTKNDMADLNNPRRENVVMAN